MEQNLTLHFDALDDSNESYLAAMLGLLTIQIGFAVAIKYLERVSRTKNILTVYTNRSIPNTDISHRQVRMAYNNSPIHIKSVLKLLSICGECTRLVSKSGTSLNLKEAARLMSECGYEFDTAEYLSRKDVNARKAFITALLTSVVSVSSMVNGNGTVSGATCAAVAIGLVGANAVDIHEAITPRLYAEVGIRSTNDVLQVCKKWLSVYSEFEKIQKIKYSLPKLEYKLLQKIMVTVGETLRFTGMALRSYVTYL